MVGLSILLYAVFVICKTGWDTVQTIRKCGAKSSIVVGSIIITIIRAFRLKVETMSVPKIDPFSPDFEAALVEEGIPFSRVREREKVSDGGYVVPVYSPPHVNLLYNFFLIGSNSGMRRALDIQKVIRTGGTDT